MKKILFLVVMVFALCANAQEQESDGNIVEKTKTGLSSIFGGNKKKEEIWRGQYVAIDLGLSVNWSSTNVGAEAPEMCGDYFCWGDIKPEKFYDEEYCSTFKQNISEISGNSDHDAALANCGKEWRIPTEEEFEELRTKCIWKWKSYKGMKGYMITGPSGKSIFLPAAGSRIGLNLNDLKNMGYYWTATGDAEDNTLAFLMRLTKDGVSICREFRYLGCSIRPVSSK